MVQITERIQVIRLCCFCYTVDDRPGFRTIDTVDQFPCMFLQTEAAERSFRYVVIKDQLLYQSGTLSVPLPDTVVDPFQCFPFGKAIGESHFFYPCKESLYQKFDCHPVLMVYRIRCKKVPN